MAPALGPEFLAYAFSDSTVHIVGRNNAGDQRGATALVIAPNWLLTCAHVVNKMRLNSTQIHDGKAFTVQDILAHQSDDVALIQIAPSLQILPGLAFRDPLWAEPVVTLGYPRVPLSRESALLMHSGEITTPAIRTFSGHDLFLYSAVARPGNSGGPIISTSGHVVGLVTDQLSLEDMPDQVLTGESPEELSKASVIEMPYFAGVGATVIAKAVAELTRSVALPIEDYQIADDQTEPGTREFQTSGT